MIELASIKNETRSINLAGSYTAGQWQRHTVSIYIKVEWNPCTCQDVLKLGNPSCQEAKSWIVCRSFGLEVRPPEKLEQLSKSVAWGPAGSGSKPGNCWHSNRVEKCLTSTRFYKTMQGSAGTCSWTPFAWVQAMRYCTFWIFFSHVNVTLRWLSKPCLRRAVRSNVSGCPRQEIGTASRDVEGSSQITRGASNGRDTFHSLPSFYMFLSRSITSWDHKQMGSHGLRTIFLDGQCTSRNRWSRYHVSSELESQQLKHISRNGIIQAASSETQKGNICLREKVTWQHNLTKLGQIDAVPLIPRNEFWHPRSWRAICMPYARNVYIIHIYW